MKNGILTAVAVYVALMLQTAVLPALGVSSISPDMLLVVLIPAAALWKSEPVAFMGAAAGLMIDILFGKGIGLHAVPYLVFPWVTGLVGRRFFRENAFMPAFLAGAAALLNEAVTALLIYLGRMDLSITTEMVLRAVTSSLFTAGLTVPFYLLMYGFVNRRKKTSQGVVMIGR